RRRCRAVGVKLQALRSLDAVSGGLVDRHHPPVALIIARLQARARFCRIGPLPWYSIEMAAVSVPLKRKRRWFQYSLSSLGLLVTLVCVALAWLAYERGQVRKRKAAIAAIESFGGSGSLGFD